MTYQVNEIFKSLQGEGVLAGSLATFIRLQGCPVGCRWCDSGPLADTIKGRTNGTTTNTWGPGGTKMSPAEIVSQAETWHIVITGGEPILYNLDSLIAELLRRPVGAMIQLETSGLNDLKGNIIPDWITWSPKENLGWNAPERFKRLVSEVKWVVDEALELATVLNTWQWYLKTTVGADLPYFVFMPEGCPPRPEMIDKATGMLRHAPTNARALWRFGDRLQYRLGIR